MKSVRCWSVRISAVGIGLAAVVFLLGYGNPVALAAQAKPADAKPADTKAAAANMGVSAAPEKVVYTFGTEEKVKEFTKLWQQRQGIVLRMTVLQAYWNEEQAALAAANKKFTDDYQLDVTKNYFLDDKRRVLVEREAPPQPAQAGAVAPVSPATTTPSTP